MPTGTSNARLVITQGKRMQPCSSESPWPSLFGVGRAKFRARRNNGLANAVCLGSFVRGMANRLRRYFKQSRGSHPKPQFMDDTTEQKLLAKLDNVKCTPKSPKPMP